jgi:hypothetical protein
MLVELLVMVILIASLFWVYLGGLSARREKVHVLIDLANMRQILQASALYAAENNDEMAHPTWGGDLTGPDGWAYLTSKRNREVPGALSATPGSCAGRDMDSSQFTNQLAFFKAGQVTQYLPAVNTAWCPKDVATRSSGQLRALWLGRPVKVTSYVWNATIGGYAGPRTENLNNGTYKVSRFLPTDWQAWESNESDAFNFNDAASHPEIPRGTVSARHAGLANWWRVTSPPRELAGGAIVGTFGGSADFVRWPATFDLINQKVAAPNPLLNGPGYRQ